MVAAASVLLGAIIIGRVPDISQSKLISAEEKIFVAGSQELLEKNLREAKKSLKDLEGLLAYYTAQNNFQKIKQTEEKIKFYKAKIKAIEEKLDPITNLVIILKEIELEIKEKSSDIEKLKGNVLVMMILQKEKEGVLAVAMNNIVSALEKVDIGIKTLKENLKKTKEENEKCELTDKGKEDIAELLRAIIFQLQQIKQNAENLLQVEFVKNFIGDDLLSTINYINNKIKLLDNFIIKLELEKK